MTAGQTSPWVGAELAAQNASQQSSAQKPVKCRFFTSRNGCRAGDACRYSHDGSGIQQERSALEGSLAQATGSDTSQSNDPTQGVATGVENLSIQVSRPPGSSLAKAEAPQRPVSNAESQNPREFQINQLRRRFRPKEETDDAGTSLEFGLVPSDPDFPFELDQLQCILYVPRSYPGQERPKLKVVNSEMERAFQDNVARGFDDIVNTSIRMNTRGTLLGWMNTLDRQLERLLTTTERGPTLKFVPNVGSQGVSKGTEPARVSMPKPQAKVPRNTVPVQRQQAPVPAPKVYTAEEKAQAEKRRAMETKQLESRLGRLPQFQRSSDGSSYTVPVQLPKPDRLPVPLRSLKTVKLMVPQLYPLEPSTVKLQGVDCTEAQSVEVGYAQWAKDNSNLNLMSQINYLTSNMSNFAKTPLKQPEPEPEPEPAAAEEELSAIDTYELPDHIEPGVQSDEKPHIRVVPRPPEWTVAENDSGNDTSDITDSEDDFTADDDEEGGMSVPTTAELSTAERGVALSFPYLELYGIELLELVGLYITIKCERCKEPLDVKNIPQAKENSDAYSPKTESCNKCANSMSVGFRRQLMHPNSNRAGYLDLDGCTVGDLLPSQFIPTCAECSTTLPAPGITAVRGESATASCRQCHRKMVMKLPEVKFLRIASAAVTSRDRGPRRKPKEVLGIVAGQELPRRGRCTHYAKSYRWFRFGCCAKVYPCDKCVSSPQDKNYKTETNCSRCHDAATDHPNEHANRMICGFCSREQHYRPENCGVCHAILIGKAGSGFWEGGKGTRNRVLMSRKDPRKFKRRGGTAANANSARKK